MTRDLVRLAYLEFKVARQFSTANGDVNLASWRPPGWFFWSELGFGTGEAPSLEETLRQLDVTNRRNLRLFAQREGRDLANKRARGKKKGGAKRSRPATGHDAP